MKEENQVANKNKEQKCEVIGKKKEIGEMETVAACCTVVEMEIE